MKYMFLLSLLFFSNSFFSQIDVDIKFMLRGYFYANSSIEDSISPGGFADFGNQPIKINEKDSFEENSVAMFIDVLMENTFEDDFSGYTLYLSNTTDTVAEFDGQDSRLYIHAQAFVDGSWQDIEYLPSSWCGNSYHIIYLKPNEYWEFEIPKYTGEINTRIRYVLKYNGSEIYSNEYSGGINREQLTVKQGYQPQGIMDPYTD